MPYFFDKSKGMYPNIREQKNELRKKFREKRKNLSPELKSEWDESICKRLCTLASIRYADEILSFSPLAGEVNITDFNMYALDSGRSLYLPRCKTDGSSEMSFHLVKSLESLTKGSYSISEPSLDAPVWSNSENMRSVCIIPAMSYDKRGFRLGYGKGFYDRYLASKSSLKIGVCYTSFLSDSLPRGRYDLAVDIIVTEKGIITIGK